MIWFKRNVPAALRRFEKQILKLEADLDAAERTISVLESERESLALVIARDRQRIEAELASYARQKAESEGADGQRTNPSLRHVG